jgi:hypothetical protein
MWWLNYIVNRQEVTWISRRSWIRSGTGTIGPRQETMLRIAANNATLAQSVAAPNPDIGAKCISTMSGHHSKGWPSMQQGPSHGATKETDTSQLLWTILLSSWKPMPLPTKRLRQWRKNRLTTSSTALEYLGSYVVTKAVNLSLVWCRRFCSTWEWARHTSHPCTCNLTARLSATS